MQKTQKAAEEQIADITILRESGYESQMSSSLKQLAEVRIKYPDATLAELSKLYEQETGDSVSKSGLRHRFIRIHELAEEERLRRKEQE